MIEVRVDTISPSVQGLSLGCVVTYSNDGPVRFAQAVIPWTAFGRDTRGEMLAAFNKIRDEILDSEPLF